MGHFYLVSYCESPHLCVSMSLCVFVWEWLLKGKLKQATNQIVSGTKGYTNVSGHSLCYKVHDHEKIYIVEADMQVQQMR